MGNGSTLVEKLGAVIDSVKDGAQRLGEAVSSQSKDVASTAVR
jgi:hypothetical protein